VASEALESYNFSFLRALLAIAYFSFACPLLNDELSNFVGGFKACCLTIFTRTTVPWHIEHVERASIKNPEHFNDRTMIRGSRGSMAMGW